MRWFFVLALLLLALGTLRTVGCGDVQREPECRTDADCDDQNECTDDRCSIADSIRCVFEPSTREGEVCDDSDGNECAFGRCRDGVCTTGTGSSFWVENNTPCDANGSVQGVCLCGACVVDPCLTDEECDDGNECTYDGCHPCGHCFNQTSYWECEPCDRNGVEGVCRNGVCEEPECLTDEDCGDDACSYGECYRHCRCDKYPKCDDFNDCTDDSCDPNTGECFYAALPDGTYCGCADWYFGICCPPCCFTPCQCCADEMRCQNGQCI